MQIHKAFVIHLVLFLLGPVKNPVPDERALQFLLPIVV
jgi:hypothetical protein